MLQVTLLALPSAPHPVSALLYHVPLMFCGQVFPWG